MFKNQTTKTILAIIFGVVITLALQYGWHKYETQKIDARIKTSLEGFSKATDKVAFVKNDLEALSKEGGPSITFSTSSANENCETAQIYQDLQLAYMEYYTEYAERYGYNDTIGEYFEQVLNNFNSIQDSINYWC